MAKIIDLDDLNQGTEIVFNRATKTIQLLTAGNLSTDGVTIQCVYSFCKDEWKSDANLIKQPFPMKAIDGPSGTQFDMIGGWDWEDVTTRELLRDGGWSLKDGAGVSLEEYMNLTSLGAFHNSSVDKAYYTQGDADSPTDLILAGEVNQAIKIYGDGSHGDFDYRGDFIIFLREEAKIFDQYDLLTEQNISALTYKKYALPLSNASDAIKVTHTDAEMTTYPWSDVTLDYYTTTQNYSIGGNNYGFNILIDANTHTLEVVYERIQYQLRQTTDIDDNTGSMRGDTADELLYWVGDTLHTQQGVYITNLVGQDTNRVVFNDITGVDRTHPYAAAGTLSFNSALQNDGDAIYRMFFTNNDAGDDDGSDFGTDDAIIVNDNVGTPISGSISGVSSIAFDYDYDGNVQRGAGSAGTDVPVTLVAIGLETAQYVSMQGTLTRTKANNFSFVANDELTYTDPA